MQCNLTIHKRSSTVPVPLSHILRAGLVSMARIVIALSYKMQACSSSGRVMVSFHLLLIVGCFEYTFVSSSGFSWLGPSRASGDLPSLSLEIDEHMC